jgi:DNA-binding LacI/PurR family transcriptional regulator
MNYGLKSREAEEAVRSWLESSGIPVGGRLPSERQLAKELGINHSVMNRVMARLLAEGQVERRGYRSFRAAQEEMASPSPPCDLVIYQRSKRLPGLRKVAQELRIPLREHLAGSAEDLTRQLLALAAAPPKSLVLVPPHAAEREGWEPAARLLQGAGVPIVTVGRRVSGFSSVASDHGLEKIFLHLASLNHLELALLVASPWPRSVEKTTARWASLCSLFASDASRERVMQQNSSHLLAEDLKAIADQLNAEWRPVTALVISTDDDLPIQRLLDALRRHKISVPGRLSVISLFDHPPLQTAVPPIAAALEDLAMEHETAFQLVRRELRMRSRLGRSPSPVEIDVALDVHDRQSLITNPCRIDPTETPLSAGLARPAFFLHPENPDSAGEGPYESSRRVKSSQFRPVDLSGKVNRPLNFRRGWLGDLPLGSLPPGKKFFHGVPFEILGGPTRRDCGAIVFQSLRNTTGRTAKLPDRVRIPVNAKARAIYFLHGCGYVKNRQQFATYAFFNRKTLHDRIPLIALGRPLPGAETWELAEAVLEANIQDWWPDYPQCHFRHARMVPLPDTRTAGPVRGHIYLYTLEWINPSPERPVSHIEIEADPNQSTTLGVLAATLLRA